MARRAALPQMQSTQHMNSNMGGTSSNSGSSNLSTHQAGQLFANGSSHSPISSESLTSALNLLPSGLLGSLQQLNSPFGQPTSSQPAHSSSHLAHVPLHLQQQQHSGPSSQMLHQANHPQTSSQQHQHQHSHQPQQQATSSHQHGQQQQPSQHQSNQHQSQQQSLQQATLAQLFATPGSDFTAPGPTPQQQHASILSDARSSVSAFSAALQEAKHSVPGDRPDIRAVVASLERASKALASELGRGIAKLKSLNDSASLNNPLNYFASANTSNAQNGMSQDLFGAISSFGLPNGGQQQQQQQHGPQGQQGMPFDPAMMFAQNQTQHNNPIFNGLSNLNGIAGNTGFNGPFGNELGMQPHQPSPANNVLQTSPFLQAMLAQALSQPDAQSRLSALSLLSSAFGSGTGTGSLNVLDSLLSQQQRGPAGLDTNTGAPAVPAVSSSNASKNAAALAALTSLGVTPAMFEALGLGSLVSQVAAATAASQSDDGSSKPTTEGDDANTGLDESRDDGGSGPSSEPARKKRKQGRGKPISIGLEPANVTRASPASSGTASAPPQAAGPRSSTSTSTVSSSIPGASNPSSTSKRIPTLGVGLRQEGDKRYRNRKLLRDLREHLYRWLGTDEFRKLKHTYKVAEWVPNPFLTDEEKQILASLPPGGVAQPPITTHIFHVDFTSRDFYRTNQALIDAIVTEGSKKVEAKPEAYGIVPGTIDRDHLEDVAKDLMDSARSGFRMSLRTGVQAEKEDKEKHEKYRGVERAKTKCRNREIGAGRLRHAIPKQLLIPGAYSDDAASDEDLHGLTKSEWKRQRLRKLRIAKGWEAVTPKWRNKHLTRAYHKADIVSKSKQMARWRRDEPVDLPIPIKLYGKTLPKQLFDPDWLKEHRKELEDEPYCIKINEADIEGWEESHHPLGEDTSDEMEWSDAKESSSRGRQMISTSTTSRGGSTTRSPVPLPPTNAASKPEQATPEPTTGEPTRREADSASMDRDLAPATSNAVSNGTSTRASSTSDRADAPQYGDDTESESGSEASGSDELTKDKAHVLATSVDEAKSSQSQSSNVEHQIEVESH